MNKGQLRKRSLLKHPTTRWKNLTLPTAPLLIRDRTRRISSRRGGEAKTDQEYESSETRRHTARRRTWESRAEGTGGTTSPRPVQSSDDDYAAQLTPLMKTRTTVWRPRRYDGRSLWPIRWGVTNYLTVVWRSAKGDYWHGGRLPTKTPPEKEGDQECDPDPLHLNRILTLSFTFTFFIVIVIIEMHSTTVIR